MLLDALQHAMASFSALAALPGGTEGINFFRIYSIGDAEYMRRVLNAVAMMRGYIVLLGKAGLLIGLVLIVGKGVTTGGQKVELGWFFIGLLTFLFMFGNTTTVYVVEKGGAPGTNPDAYMKVDNVPMGVAIMGWAVSGIGFDLASKMSQSMSTPGISTGMGFGRTLKWINAVRNWDLPEFDDDTLQAGIFKENVAAYLADCTQLAAQQGTLDLKLALTGKDPFTVGTNTNGGILTDNKFATTRYIPQKSAGGRGAVDQPNCLEGGKLLAADADNPSLLAAVGNAIAPRNMSLRGVTGEGDGATDVTASGGEALSNAFLALGAPAQAAQDFVVNSAVAFAWKDMVLNGTGGNSLDALSSVMINTAVQQRSMQWAGEENMFRRVAQPMTAFFESMIYALAPFMAFALGLGAFGFKMLSRYLVLTIWVTLWAPVLALVDLFQTTMAQHAYAAMVVNDSLPQSSIAGTVYLQTQITNWMSVGATLAAATPVLALSILFGGAYTATALAGKLQGGDHINERMASPDPISVSPGMEVRSHMASDRVSGMQVTGSGSAAPNIKTGDDYSYDESSKMSAAETSRQQLVATFGRQINDQYSVLTQGAASAGGSVSAGDAHKETASAKHQSQWGLRDDVSSADNYVSTSSVNVSASASGGLSKMGAMPTGGGRFAGAMPKVPISGGVSGTATMGETTTASTSSSDGAGTGSSVSHGLDSDYSKVQDLKEKADFILSQNGGHAITSATGSTFSDAYTDVQARETAYQESMQRSSSFGTGSTLNVQEFAHGLAGADGGKGAAYVAMGRELAGEAVDAQKAYNSQFSWGKGEHADIIATSMVLDGNNASRHLLPDGDANASARHEAMLYGMENSGMSGAFNPRYSEIDPAKYESMASNASGGFATTAARSGQLGAQNINPDVIKSTSMALANNTNGALMHARDGRANAAGVLGSTSDAEGNLAGRTTAGNVFESSNTFAVGNHGRTEGQADAFAGNLSKDRIDRNKADTERKADFRRSRADE